MSTQPSRPAGVPDLRPLLSPESIAIIGASEDPTRLSGRPLQILLQHHFPGRIYPVNPRHQTVAGLPAYPSIAAVPGPVDLAAIIVKAALVPQMLRECADAGVRAATVFSSGFAEEGSDGRRAEGEIAAIARSSGMRVLGPNAEGFFNLTGGIPVTFSPTVDYERGLTRLMPGNVAVVSQSGGLGLRLVQLGSGGRPGLELRGQHRQRGRPRRPRDRRLPAGGCRHRRGGSPGGGLPRQRGAGAGRRTGRRVGQEAGRGQTRTLGAGQPGRHGPHRP